MNADDELRTDWTDGDNSDPAEEESLDNSDRSERSFGFSKRMAIAGDRRSTSHLWLVSYSDFMTIMMIFFLGLYGYTVLVKTALIQQHQRSYSEFAQTVSKLKDPLGQNLQVQDDIGRLIVQLPDHVLFPVGRADLNQNAINTLQQVARSLKLVEGEIIVEGHTDPTPIRAGRYKTNMELSAARAFSVIETLTKFGVPAERLAAWGFG